MPGMRCFAQFCATWQRALLLIFIGGALGFCPCLLAQQNYTPAPANPSDSDSPPASSLAILENEEQPLEARMEALKAWTLATRPAGATVDKLVSLISDSETPVRLRLEALQLLAPFQPGSITPSQSEPVLETLADSQTPLELRQQIFQQWSLHSKWLAAFKSPLTATLLDSSVATDFRLSIGNFLLRSAPSDEEVLQGWIQLLQQTGTPESLQRLALKSFNLLDNLSASQTSALRDFVLETGHPASIRKEALRLLALHQRGSTEFKDLCLVLLGTTGPAELQSAAVGELSQSPLREEELQLRALEILKEGNLSQETAEALINALQPMQQAPSRFSAWLVQKIVDPATPEGMLAFALNLLDPSSVPNPTEELLPGLIAVLKDRDHFPGTRNAAARLLRSFGARTQSYRDTLIEFVKNSSHPEPARIQVAALLADIAQSMLSRPDRLSRSEMNRQIQNLRSIQYAIQQGNLPGKTTADALESIKPILEVLQAEKESRWWDPLLDWMEEKELARNPFFLVVCFVISYAVLINLLWTLLYGLQPQLIQTLHHRLKRFDVNWIGRSFGPRHLLLLPPWIGRSRVMCRWIERWWPPVRTSFQEQPWFKSGLGYIPLAVHVEESSIEMANYRHFRSLAQDSHWFLACIHGHRGNGKSTLAAYLACTATEPEARTRWSDQPLLPLWFSPQSEWARHPTAELLVEELKRWFYAVFPQRSGADEETFLYFRNQQRFLVIFDDFHRWPPESRDAIPEIMKAVYPLPRILLVSQSRADLDPFQTCNVEVLRLDGTNISRFAEASLRQTGRRDWFSDTEFMESCRQLSSMTLGRTLSSQLVKYYVETLTISKLRHPAAHPFENFSDVVVHRLCLDHENVPGEKPAWNEVYPWATQLAWRFVRAFHAPIPLAKSQQETSSGDHSVPPRMFQYLHEGLQLLESAAPCTEAFFFTHATAAEYLAARHLVETYRDDEVQWRGFMDWVRAHATRVSPDFVTALDEVIFSMENRVDPETLPPWLRSEIQELLRLDSLSGGSSARLQSRVEGLLHQLLTPDPAERTSVFQQLKELGPEARSAVPQLIQTFRNRREDLEVRQSALQALDAMGSSASAAAAALAETVADPQEHLFFRVQTVDVLRNITAHPEETNAFLLHRLADPRETTFLRNHILRSFLRLREPPSGFQSLVRQLRGHALPEDMQRSLDEHTPAAH